LDGTLVQIARFSARIPENNIYIVDVDTAGTEGRATDNNYGKIRGEWNTANCYDVVEEVEAAAAVARS
jgi:hypothetical protein